MEKDNSITIITTAPAQEVKAGLPNFKGFAKSEIKLNADTLSKNLQEFLNKIKPVVEAQTITIGQFAISEIEFHLAINASGGIDLIGKVDVGIEGGIKIKLTRQQK